MSPSPGPSESSEAETYTVIIASHVTHHIVIPPKAGSKGKPKDKKEVKTKELSHSFSPTLENYIAFLNALLAKHGEEKYNITEKKQYGLKVLCPPAKVFVLILLI